MPAKSENQQQAAGAALAAKRGKISPKKLKGASKSMYASMSAKQLEDFASTKTKGLPKRVKKSADLTAQDQAFLEGFVLKCAEYGIDPEELLEKAAAVGGTEAVMSLWPKILAALKSFGRGAKAVGRGFGAGMGDIVSGAPFLTEMSKAPADLAGKSLKAWQAGHLLSAPTLVAGPLAAMSLRKKTAESKMAGVDKPGKRDGTGPWRGSWMRAVHGGKGRRQLAGEECPATKKDKKKKKKDKEKSAMSQDVKLTPAQIAYLEGFVEKCAELNVDPEELLEKAAAMPGAESLKALWPKILAGLKSLKGRGAELGRKAWGGIKDVGAWAKARPLEAATVGGMGLGGGMLGYQGMKALKKINRMPDYEPGIPPGYSD